MLVFEGPVRPSSSRPEDGKRTESKYFKVFRPFVEVATLHLCSVSGRAVKTICK